MQPTALFSDRFRAFGVLTAQLVLVLLFVYRFEIETRQQVFPMLCLAVGGFMVHAWLPPRWRLGFFVLLSLAGVLFVLGLVNGAKVIGIGLALVTLCHLPIPALLRAVLLLLAAGILAGMRIDDPKGPFWPVLASMFMFRVIVYLFELRHSKPHTPSVLTLAYFFPLPNVSFVLFPVLDFQTFRETYRAEDDYDVYQTGVVWMVRGLSHLVAYRIVKYYLLPAPYQLHDFGHVVLYLAATYALYLRVSGWFHLITGIFHLFGFRVPRTHDHYFLASSLSDIWRRINIYWKDFMTKVFFFPAFFTLRRFGTRLAMAVATLWVFAATWLLHSYQMFWLAGDLPLTASVAGLWLGAGLLVAISLQFDLGRAEEPAVRKGVSGFSVRTALIRALKTLTTFVVVSLFWACWTDPQFMNRLWLPGITFADVQHGLAWAAGLVVTVLTVGVLAQWARVRWLEAGRPFSPETFAGSAAVCTAALAMMLLVSVPHVAGVFGPASRDLAVTLVHDTPTFLEAAQAMHGYYEEIAETHIQAGPFLGRLKGIVPPPEQGRYADASQSSDDPLLGPLLKPGWRGMLGSAPASINSLGMRDREGISVRKPADTCRIALVGSSIVMGVGVEDNEVFKVPLEEKLNAAAPAGRPRFELLNFGTGRSMAINRVRLIETKVFNFEPDVIVLFAHQDELYSAGQYMAGIVYMKLPLPYPYMAGVVQKAGVTSETPPEALERLFAPFDREITLGLYRALVEDCRRRGVVPVWVYLPMPGIKETAVDADKVVAVAREAGFAVIDLADWAKDYEPGDVKLAPEDYHPNALGHRVIAERLFAEFRKRPELLPASARLP